MLCLLKHLVKYQFQVNFTDLICLPLMDITCKHNNTLYVSRGKPLEGQTEKIQMFLTKLLVRSYVKRKEEQSTFFELKYKMLKMCDVFIKQ